eukprot:m.482236 g.482236  ORF g.482236 m.482236 type:complete len:85 (+) comp21721_c1_seq23:1950-2204(+)
MSSPIPTICTHLHDDRARLGATHARVHERPSGYRHRWVRHMFRVATLQTGRDDDITVEFPCWSGTIIIGVSMCKNPFDADFLMY